MDFSTKNEDNCPKRDSGDDSCCRILLAAERLFAEKGFHRTSIREITTSAGCNVAGVNYHFGNKDKLYHTVLIRRFNQMHDRLFCAVKSVLDQPGPTLRAFVEAFSATLTNPMGNQEESHLFGELFFREMADRILPQDIFLNDVCLPFQEVLFDAMHTICPNLTDQQLWKCIFSLEGQLIHLIRVAKMFPETADLHASVDYEQLYEHIIEFTLAGFRAIEQGEPQE